MVITSIVEVVVVQLAPFQVIFFSRDRQRQKKRQRQRQRQRQKQWRRQRMACVIGATSDQFSLLTSVCFHSGTSWQGKRTQARWEELALKGFCTPFFGATLTIFISCQWGFLLSTLGDYPARKIVQVCLWNPKKKGMFHKWGQGDSQVVLIFCSSMWVSIERDT